MPESIFCLLARLSQDSLGNNGHAPAAVIGKFSGIGYRAPLRSRMMAGNFFAELKRRNVYKVAVAYAVIGWLLVRIATQVFPFFEIPNWAVWLVVLLLIIGFPVSLQKR
jgi:hypothetical protein